MEDLSPALPPDNQPRFEPTLSRRQLSYPFRMPPDLELALCEDVARQVLERGEGFDDAAIDALGSQLSNEHLCCGYSECVEDRVASILDRYTEDVKDKEAAAQYVAALGEALLLPAILDEVLTWLTFIDADFVPVPKAEVQERLRRVVLGEEEPWPMSRFWQRTRAMP